MSSSANFATRRIPARARSAAPSREESSSKPNSTGSSASVGGGVAALRKRSALGDMTNAGARRVGAGTSEGMTKSVDGSSGVAMTKGKLALRDSNGTAAAARGKSAAAIVAGGKAATAQVSTRIPTRRDEPADTRTTRVTRRTAASGPATGATGTTQEQRSKSVSTTSSFSRSNSVQSDASRRTAGSSKDERGVKRVKTDHGEQRVHAGSEAAQDRTLVHKRAAVLQEPVRPKDEGWEDLDGEDADDPLMVAEYVNDIFEYLKKTEVNYIPSGNYIDNHPEITWDMRGVLVDWLIDIHSKFRLVPETLFLAQNLIDRFLTLRTISLNKLQLVGLTAMFIAAKYEEVLCPSVHNFLYLAEGGYTDDEILKAERYMLKVLKFNLNYASPMNFLRRISKADNYDVQTRTVAKFFMEISLVDHRFLEIRPSLVAAAAVWNARLVLERGDWGPTLVHYSSYAVSELLPTAELMLDYCLRPKTHNLFLKKYSTKKFMKAATYVFDWTQRIFGAYAEEMAALDEEEEGASADVSDGQTGGSRLRVDLFAQCGLERPVMTSLVSTNSDVDSAVEDLSSLDGDDEEKRIADEQVGAEPSQPLSDITNGQVLANSKA